MKKPNIDNRKALDHAGATVSIYMARAIELIDRQMGEGYAKDHPGLLAECITAQALDYNSTAMVAAVYEIEERLGSISYGINEFRAFLEDFSDWHISTHSPRKGR